MSTSVVDLSADLGEGAPDDEAVLEMVTSANVACGLHAGSPSVMGATVRLAAARGVAVGAHPGYPDREGFGRRELNLDPDTIYDLVLYQIGALRAFAIAEEQRLQHVKAHGALYNRAARDPAVADAVARAIADHGGHLLLVGLAGSEHERAARRAKVPFAAEFFADRALADDGTLVPRHVPGAVIDDLDTVSARTVVAVREGRIAALSGALVPVKVQTVCLHGDAAGAGARVRAVRSALEAAGISVEPLRDWL